MSAISKEVKELIKKTIIDIQSAIQAKSNASTQKSIEKYMKNVQRFRGMKTTDLRNNIFKAMWTSNLKDLETAHRKELAHLLLAEEFGEDKTFGWLIFEKFTKGEIDLDDIKKIEELFKNGTLVGWANTDSISGSIFRPWTLGNIENTRYVCEWMNSDCIWLQRASCVTFITLAKKGDKEPNFDGFIDMLLKTCGKTIQNQERFVQLGTGWLLREIGVYKKPILKEFIIANLKFFTREGLSYATEKLSAADKTKFKNMLNKNNAAAIEDGTEKTEGKIESRGIKRTKI